MPAALERCSCSLGAVLLQPWSGAPAALVRCSCSLGAVLLQPWCGAPAALVWCSCWSGAPAALVQCSCSLGVVLLLERCSCSLGASVRIPPAAGLLPSHVFPGQNHRGNSTNHLQMTKMGAVKGKSKPAICFLIFLLLAFDLSLCLPKG